MDRIINILIFLVSYRACCSVSENNEFLRGLYFIIIKTHYSFIHLFIKSIYSRIYSSYLSTSGDAICLGDLLVFYIEYRSESNRYRKRSCSFADREPIYLLSILVLLESSGRGEFCN